MLVDRIYHPVTTLGPGERVVVWTCGCSKHCPGCANPELQTANPANEIPVERLAEILTQVSEDNDVHAITLTGGDPLEQPDELAKLLRAIRPHFSDILVYTGYTAEKLSNALTPCQKDALDGMIDVLIDGPYIEGLNDGKCALRGSTNQNIIVFNPSLQEAYDTEAELPRRIQNAVFDGRAISIGIHGAGKDRADR